MFYGDVSAAHFMYRYAVSIPEQVLRRHTRHPDIRRPFIYSFIHLSDVGREFTDTSAYIRRK